MMPPQLIYFFTSRSPAGRLAFDLARALHPLHDWRLLTIETGDDKAMLDVLAPHAPDLLLSFLNPYVVPEALLEGVNGRAFNVHPATPRNPGRDPQNFAFYEGATTAGATLHRMITRVDSGDIIDVLEAPVDRDAGVMRHIEMSEHLSIALMAKHLPALVDGTIRPAGQWCWRERARRTRGDFLRMCTLSPSLPAAEVHRRIAAFFNPAHRTVAVELHGLRFVYDPDSAPPPE
jgi:methionyl-tRNA formyltransferase